MDSAVGIIGRLRRFQSFKVSRLRAKTRAKDRAAAGLLFDGVDVDD
jgi:hypothetical protein